MKTAIVSDSTCDLSAELAEKHQISVVANSVVMEGKSYEDGKGLTREEFYNLMPTLKEQPSTATASPGVYEKLYESLLAGGADEVVSLHVSPLLSGVFNAASLGAQRFAGRVKTYDTGSVSMGVGFQALRAAEAAAQGLSAEQVLEELRRFQPRVRFMAMLDTLEYVRRSGRVSWAQARLGGLLGLRPFLEVKDGKVNSLGEARTRSKGVERLRSMLADLCPLERLAVLHTNAAKDARALYESVKELAKLDERRFPVLFVNVTTVIGTHVGPNALGFVTVGRE